MDLPKDNAQALYHALNRLTTDVFRYGMGFATSKCKIPVPALSLCDDRLEKVNKFKCLGNVIISDRSTEEKIILGIAKIQDTLPQLTTLVEASWYPA